MADFFELLKTRRSIRQFEDREVSLETIREIIRESCLAPSAANRQPWKFIIIQNRNFIKRLSDKRKKNILAFIEQ
ncbi:MAG: nitroreductase family protein, partial [Deltaproteobacteria bacterium]|nr:nitroreductase family protein [Deltaproteobacteria bacterium]